MKNIYRIYCPLIIIAIILSCFCSGRAIIANSNTVNAYETIIVDAGHGGFDGGAVKGDVVEKDVNLEIALKLEKALQTFGYKVIMTRRSDTGTNDEGLNTIRSKKVSDIHNRLDLIENTDIKCVISIHQNMFSDSKYCGTQVFYAPANEQSKPLAESIQSSTKALLQPENNRVVKACAKNIYLMYHTTKPAVMIECGFMSNAHELDNLLSDDYQKKLVFCIINGIINNRGVEIG